MPFLDISGELAAATRDHLEDYVIPINRHPNEKGDALVAALVWPHLRNLLLASHVPHPAGNPWPATADLPPCDRHHPSVLSTGELA